MFKKFLKSKTGQGMTEYILIIAVVAIAVLFVAQTFGGKIKTAFTNFSTEIGTATKVVKT